MAESRPIAMEWKACVAIQKGTRVLASLWDSLMFGRVPGTHLNISESQSEISTRVPFCIEHHVDGPVRDQKPPTEIRVIPHCAPLCEPALLAGSAGSQCGAQCGMTDTALSLWGGSDIL